MADDLMRRPHPNNALSAAFVRSTQKSGQYADGNGLYLVVSPSGSKRWMQRINVRGKRTEMGLGSAALFSLSEVREIARMNRKLARQGGDPLQEKRTAAAIMTFEEAAREVHRIHRPTWRNPKHAAQFITTLEKYTFPRLGNLKVTDLNSADVLAVLQPIWLEKPTTAKRVKQRISTVLKWTIAKGWRQDDPSSTISQVLPKQTQKVKHRKALHYDEVPGCLDKVRASGAREATKLALELIVLTACRSGEVRLADWSEFNLERAEWIIPAERMKAGVEHRVPLSSPALDLLSAAMGLGNGNGLVFPGTKFGKPLSDMTILKLVRELGFNVDIHGFRTSFKTWCQERTNTPREVSEAALAHSIQNKTELAYARSDLFEKRRVLLDRWAAHLHSKECNVTRIG